MTPPPAPRVLPVLAGLLALALVAGAVIPWLWLFVVGPAGFPDRPPLPRPVFLLQAVSGGMLLHLLAATWFATPWFERRGVIPAAAGLLVFAGWPAAEAVIGQWRSHPIPQLLPELLGVEQHAMLVANLGVTLLTVVLLVVGAALLMSRPDPD